MSYSSCIITLCFINTLQVLKKVAAFLKDGFRATDYPARIGGDEFAVILTSMSEEMQGAVERKITEMNDRLMHPNDGLPQVSLSVGGAFSENGFTDDLYQKADADRKSVV